MRNPYHKPQHEVFIRCMQKHGDATRAYRAAYPNASRRSASTAGLRLCNQAHIRSRIQPILDQRREEADREAMKKAQERVNAEHARRRYIRNVIYDIAHRQIKKNRYFTINGKTVVAQEDLSHTALINLITLDLKLAGGYSNWPSIERQFAHWTHNTAPKSEDGASVCGNPHDSAKSMVPLKGTGVSGQHATSTSACDQWKDK